MPRLCANISFLFTERPFTDRFKAAADAGFSGVEFLFPYAEEAERLADLAAGNNLDVVLFNIWPGDFDNGWRGLAGVPGYEELFAERVAQALEYARKLGCKQLHAMAGLDTHGANEATLVSNLKTAARMAQGDGIAILTEPINARDMPGYLVQRTAQAAKIIEDVGMPNVRLQLDLYHRQMQEGDVAAAIRDFAGIASHIQIAGPPDRGEPHPSDLDFAALFKVIEETGYKGWIGCEYRPRGDTLAGLIWRDALGLGV